jgi:hypothetical protein
MIGAKRKMARHNTSAKASTANRHYSGQYGYGRTFNIERIAMRGVFT